MKFVALLTGTDFFLSQQIRVRKVKDCSVNIFVCR